MRELLSKSKDGFIPLEELTSRMQKLVWSHNEIELCNNAIINYSTMLEVSEDGLCVRRVTPLPEFRSMMVDRDTRSDGIRLCLESEESDVHDILDVKKPTLTMCLCGAMFFFCTLGLSCIPFCRARGKCGGSRLPPTIARAEKVRKFKAPPSPPPNRIPIIVDDPHAFTVFDWNVLAQFLATEEFFPYVKPEFLDWEYRRRFIRKEIRYYSADVLCLQEVQSVENWWSTSAQNNKANHVAWFKRFLEKDGYRVFYKRKPLLPESEQPYESTGVDIGNLIAYKESKFELLEKWEINLADALSTMIEDVGFVTTFRRYNQVALFVLLRHKETAKNLLVLTSHLTSRFHEPQFQIMQLRVICNMVSKIRHGLGEDRELAVVFAGDFNSLEMSIPYRFLRDGQIGTRPEDQACLDLIRDFQVFPPPSEDVATGLQVLTHDLTFESAYRSVLQGEPKFTNFTDNFKGTLDYVWYTPRSLIPVSVLNTLSAQTLSEEVGIPSSRFPSDHLPLFALFHFVQ